MFARYVEAQRAPTQTVLGVHHGLRMLRRRRVRRRGERALRGLSRTAGCQRRYVQRAHGRLLHRSEHAQYVHGVVPSVLPQRRDSRRQLRRRHRSVRHLHRHTLRLRNRPEVGAASSFRDRLQRSHLREGHHRIHLHRRRVLRRVHQSRGGTVLLSLGHAPIHAHVQQHPGVLPVRRPVQSLRRMPLVPRGR